MWVMVLDTAFQKIDEGGLLGKGPHNYYYNYTRSLISFYECVSWH